MTLPIITSLLDSDLYKYSMAQVVWKNFPNAQVEYAYKCRNNSVDLQAFIPQIKEQIKHLCSLKFTTEELQYLGKLRFMDPSFIWFLKYIQLDENCVEIFEAPFGLKIKGPWLYVILFEVFLLAIISEAAYRATMTGSEIEVAYEKGRKLLADKIKLIQELDEDDFRLTEFGTRRRFSKEWQEEVLGTLLEKIPGNMFGTSNVKLAMDHGIKPIGTMAHEYLQAFQALGPRLVDSQKAALETWAQFYRGDLGIALTDVISMDAFLKDFDLFYSKLFDGMRHDSGCPFVWGEKAIAHYQSMQIDPRTKALIFSDSLDIPKAIALYKHFEPRIKTSYGIGTNLTNDLPGVTPINHVIKMVTCDGHPVAKLSDSPGKSMCEDEAYLTYLKRVFSYNVLDKNRNSQFKEFQLKIMNH